MLHRSWAIAAALLGSFVFTSAGYAEPAATASPTVAAEKVAEETPTKFLRVQRDEDNEEVTSLETAIVSYRGLNPEGEEVQVDLVGAVHIGDTQYYRNLNDVFGEYDVVLYELVAPKGARPGRGTAGVWSPLANMLSLDDQILRIDYQRENFVHADMSWDEMVQSMEKRQESFLNMFFRMVGQSIALDSTRKQGGGEGELLAGLLFSKNPSLTWKRVMAAQFEDSDKAMRWLEGPEADGSTLIHERNKVALKVLKEQIAAGKKKLAVFYGAGHLPDMEKRLREDFQLKRSGEPRWLTAWDLSDK